MPTTPLTEMRLLSNARISRIIGTLAATLEVQRPLIYLNRLPLVPAFNDELIGRFTGKIYAADIVADDQKAAVQEGLSLELLTHAIPNIKIGQKLDQKLLDRLYEFDQRGNVEGEDALRNWENKIAENLLLAVRWRQNQVACAMMLDAFDYARLGVQVSGATWGMPADLKVTVGTAWGANPTTAKPITDVMSLNEHAWVTYGIRYNLMTMGTADFIDMVSTTEFANKATLNVGLPAAFLVTPAAIAQYDLDRMREIVGKILNMTIELDEAVIREKNLDGTSTATKVLPAHKVLLSRTEDDGNGATWDMANGVVTESQGEIPGVPAMSRGPVAYYTPVSHDHNPPGQIAWGVAKSFARKFVPEATAVLTVG